ncbi:MAG: dTDP-4-dehydrorhamnose 3,5-epimerase [Desulfovibrio sp.]|nr:dTDP-4-dehydrorhamnose 3,5-epimerase [Desulfovibrio sp.]
MDFEYLAENGPVLLVPRVFGDERGYFMETFRQNEFEAHCGRYEFVQDNQSLSQRRVLRGLHYQLNHPQGKLVRVIMGRVYDVAVDLRASSPDFGRCYGVVLDNIEHKSLWVPPGFAHGFYVLSDKAEFVYKCTAYYDPADERSLIWNDPTVNVDWPLEGEIPILSAKDEKGLPWDKADKYS